MSSSSINCSITLPINQLSPKKEQSNPNPHQLPGLSTYNFCPLGQDLSRKPLWSQFHQHPRILQLEMDTILLRGDAVPMQQWQLDQWFPPCPSDA